MVKSQRVRFHSNGAEKGVWYFQTRFYRKEKMCVSNRNVLESSKGLYKRDISTIVSNYSKYCSFWFFYADNDLTIDINNHRFNYIDVTKAEQDLYRKM